MKLKQHGSIVIAEERLYLDKAQTKVVREGEPGAAFLLAAKGQPVPPRYLPLLKQAQAAPEPTQATLAPEAIEQRQTRPARASSRR